MSTKTKITDYVETDHERLVIVNGEQRWNKARRYAEVSVQVNYEQADGAQIVVALAALDKVYAQAYAHLNDLLESAQQREDREARREGDL